MSRVSIVIPCLRQDDLVEMAVRSCLRQSHLHEIIIVVGDVSEGFLTELSSLVSELPLLRLTSMDAQVGMGRARNFGAEQATGDYICFLNSHDELLSDFFATTVPLLDLRPEFSSIKVGIQVLDIYGAPVILPGDPRYIALLSTFSGNLILRRTAFIRMGGFSEDPRFSGELAGEEAAFSSAVEQYLAPVGFLPEAFYRHNDRPGSRLQNFLKSTKVVGNNVFEFRSIVPEQAADGILGKAIDNYLKSVKARLLVSEGEGQG